MYVLLNLNYLNQKLVYRMFFITFYSISLYMVIRNKSQYKTNIVMINNQSLTSNFMTFVQWSTKYLYISFLSVSYDVLITAMYSSLNIEIAHQN